ncbi:MAG: TIGR02266 family protein [Deltaproteobacteria bacterium]|nr:TIGR02266 family protein [Deltaproteobacteria bacterium]
MASGRQNERVKLDVKVDLKEAGQFHRVRSRDVSSGGLFIEMESPCEAGAELDLLLRLEDRHIIRVKAMVCWVRHDEDDFTSGVGVAFTHIDEQDQVDLDNTIRGLQAQSANEDAESRSEAQVS